MKSSETIQQGGTCSREQVLLASTEHYSFMLRLARTQLYSPTDAEDVVQEAVVAALQSWHTYEGRSSLKAWLLGILKYKIIDQIKIRMRDLKHLSFDVSDFKESDIGDDENSFTAHGEWNPDTFSSHMCPVKNVEKEQLLEIVEFCMTKLSKENSKIFLMREYLGLEITEIARLLYISEGNLRVILHRIRLRLRTCVVRGWGEYL